MENAIFAALIFLANMIQTITGFAGTMLVMPFAILLKGPDFAVAVLNLLALIMCGYLVLRNRKMIMLSELRRILPLLLAGMAAGLLLYRVFRSEALLKIYAWFLLVIAVICMATGQKLRLSGWQSWVILFFAGVAHGIFVSGGPLLVLYALNRMPDKQRFRATLCAVWVVTNAILVLQHFGAGYYTPPLLISLFYALPALAAGVYVGNRVYRCVSQACFLRISYFLLVVTAGYILLSK